MNLRADARPGDTKDAIPVHRNACPLCCGTHLAPAFSCRDALLSQEQFVIVRCGVCGFLFTQDVPGEEEIHRYYATDRYLPHDVRRNDAWGKAVDAARRAVRLPRKRRWVERAAGKTAGKLLDIGCGSGEFPWMMQHAGWIVTAIEPDTAMREHCRARGIDCRDTPALHELPDSGYDAITLWHVLEHVHDLHGTVAHVRRLLKPDGVALLALPNIGGPLHRFYGTYDVPRHLWHFRPETLSRLAATHGLVIESVRVLHLDPLYAGLYYERMLGGSALRGIALGLRDIAHAVVRPADAGSLLYVLRPVPDSAQSSGGAQGSDPVRE